MKNLAKIFMVIVVAFAAYSCVADATEDLGVQVGNGEVGTTITLSLEESRTQLGDKTEAGLYPLYWSEGDAIAVNGVASDALTAAQAGKSEAVFKLNGAHNYPYHIVYPVPAEGVVAKTEGCFPVVFPATQEYVEGNLDGKSAPMYGCAEQGASPVLHHLTGILRLAIKGDVTLSNLTLAAEEGYLAGTYDVNCETGALTPQDGATSGSIYMSFGDGLALSADEATLIHIAVPEGEYGAVSVVLNTTDDQHMYAKFSSKDDKYIKAGKVREFAEFVFVANSEIDTVVFEISDVATLKQFAELVKANKFYPRNEAKVVAPIDMTGEEWTPIDGFNYTFNGNDQTITGLTAPLFGTAGANIKDLTLADVNIESNGRLTLGAVACVLTDGSISNCKVSGTINVSNTAATIASGANADTTVNIGGVVGTSQGDIDGCVNLADITVNQVAKADNAVAVHPSVGGVVGYSVTGAVTNCVNGNEAKTAGAINYHDNQATQLYVPHVGGVAGRGAADNTSAFTDNTNYGAISFKANGAGDTSISYKSITVAGVVGCSYGNIENNGNYGAITIAQSAVKALYVGGVVSVAIPTTPFKNNHNYTDANITIDSDVTFHCLTVAGVLSGLNGGLADASGGGLFNCSNDGAINVKASTASDITLNSTNYYRIGGVVGYINRSVQDCENKANGDITLEGDVVLTRNNYQSGFNVAGVYAYQSSSGSHKENTNRGDINVYTNVSKHSSLTSTTPEVDSSDRILYKMDIGGVAGHVQRPPVGKEENFGLITIGKADGTVQNITANGIYISGVIAQRYNRTVGADSSAVNHGDITINSGVTLNGFTVGVFIGGCTAYNGTPNSGNTTQFYNYSNSGDITINGDIDDLSYIGGVIAYANGASISTSSNTGAISLSSTATILNAAYIGGAVGYTPATELSGVKNSGAMTIGGTISGISYVGGVTGTYAGTLTSCENHGSLDYRASNGDFIYLGGINGNYEGATITDCTNTGDVTLTNCTTSPKELDIYAYVGGIAGITKAVTLTGCNNSGVLTVPSTLTSGFELYIGGLAGFTNAITLDNCHNLAKEGTEYGLVLDYKCYEEVNYASNRLRAGGLVGESDTVTTKNGVSNSANMHLTCIYLDSGGFSVGGLVGVTNNGNHKLNGNVSNSGNIYYAGQCPYGTFAIGGCFGQMGSGASKVVENMTNTGDITAVKTDANWKPASNKTKNGYIGGIAGSCSGTLPNSKSYCTITAIDFEDTHNTSYYNSVGAIIGAKGTATTVPTGCHTGGAIILTSGEVGTLTVDNYAYYLTGAHDFTSATAKSQNCGFITSIDDTTPEYAE
ncbi:MAG: hypothetical protein E7129_04320 [Rikenellaceae bacterium]|nr:hypothetical protein [Rikenellaceae bacterium]